jgi:hypothetical protein
LVAVSVKPELFYGRDGHSSDDYRISITHIELLENLIKKVRDIAIDLPSGYIDEDFISGMGDLIQKHPNPKGACVTFPVMDSSTGMDIQLSSGEKVDAKAFCKDLRKLMQDDEGIGLG